MNVTKTKCDLCGKESEDRYESVGWIQMESGYNGRASITISRGRKPSGEAKSAFLQFSQIDLCGKKCLERWFDKLREQK